MDNKLTVIFTTCLLLSGCTAVTNRINKTIDDIGREIDPYQQQDSAASQNMNLYCYKTISSADCYSKPQKNQNGRILGVTDQNFNVQHAALLTAPVVVPPDPPLPPMPEPKYDAPIPKTKPKAEAEPDKDLKITINGTVYSSKALPSDAEMKKMEEKEWQKTKYDSSKMWLENDPAKADEPVKPLPKNSDFFVQQQPDPAADSTKKQEANPADSPMPGSADSAPTPLQQLPK